MNSLFYLHLIHHKFSCSFMFSIVSMLNLYLKYTLASYKIIGLHSFSFRTFRHCSVVFRHAILPQRKYGTYPIFFLVCILFLFSRCLMNNFFTLKFNSLNRLYPNDSDLWPSELYFSDLDEDCMYVYQVYRWFQTIRECPSVRWPSLDATMSWQTRTNQWSQQEKTT